MQANLKRTLLFFSTVCLLLFFIVTRAGDRVTLPAGIIELSGEPAPGLILKNMDGESFDLREHRGSWVFVHFWATWCGPCRREMPTIQRMVVMPAFNGIKLALVNTAEDDDRVFSFMGVVAPDLIPLMDYDGLVTEQWQPRGLPSTFFIDPQGRRRYLALGGRVWDSPEFLAFLKQIKVSK